MKICLEAFTHVAHLFFNRLLSDRNVRNVTGHSHCDFHAVGLVLMRDKLRAMLCLCKLLIASVNAWGMRFI